MGNTFRKVQIRYWEDSFIQDLSPEDKYFYLFIMTNPHTTECGIYEITIKKICFYTGYNEETVNKLIKRFTDYGKINYNKETSEMAILNKSKYLNNAGKPVLDCLKSELSTIKDKSLIESVGSRSIMPKIKEVYDAFTISGQEKEEEKEEEEEPNDRFNEFWNMYNKKTNKSICINLWNKLKQEDINNIFYILPKYIKSTPDLKYRKNPDTFLKNRTWEDEIYKPPVIMVNL